MYISNWLAQKILDAMFRGVSFTLPSTLYLALYTSNPTGADTGTEVSGGGYTRLQLTNFTAAAISNFVRYHPLTGQQMNVQLQHTKNNADIVGPILTADWGLVTHLGIKDAATGGNLLFYGSWSSARTLETGDRPRILSDALVLTLG